MNFPIVEINKGDFPATYVGMSFTHDTSTVPENEYSEDKIFKTIEGNARADIKSEINAGYPDYRESARKSSVEVSNPSSHIPRLWASRIASGEINVYEFVIFYYRDGKYPRSKQYYYSEHCSMYDRTLDSFAYCNKHNFEKHKFDLTSR
jgi:hypothetical protein